MSVILIDKNKCVDEGFFIYFSTIQFLILLMLIKSTQNRVDIEKDILTAVLCFAVSNKIASCFRNPPLSRDVYSKSFIIRPKSQFGQAGSWELNYSEVKKKGRKCVWAAFPVKAAVTTSHRQLLASGLWRQVWILTTLCFCGHSQGLISNKRGITRRKQDYLINK